ncbi:MAG: hypothetical protein JW943_05420 [Deltaproteobacteria bacterium]|nr:hypothetical protein [Deltaproteobacteria bacterium]
MKKIIMALASVLIFAATAQAGWIDKVKETTSDKIALITSNVDPALVNQVPADKREGFAEAEYELQVASDKLQLAELKTERASAQKKYAEYEKDMAENYRKVSSLAYDVVKIEAIDKCGLGKSKEANAKLRSDLQVKKLKVQADKIDIQAGLDKTKAKIEELSAQIAKMEEAVKAMKFDGGKAQPADQPAAQPVAQPTENK